MQNFVAVPTVPVFFLYLKRLTRKCHFSESGWSQNTDLAMTQNLAGNAQCGKDKKLLCGRLKVKGRETVEYLPSFAESGLKFFKSRSSSLSHFLQLVKGMTDRQTLSATFRNSYSLEYSDIPKLSEAQNEMCSQLGASQLGTKKKFLNVMDFCFE